MDNQENLLVDDEFFETFEEEIFYECYDCGWSGKDPFEQSSDLWAGQTMFICPECGGLLND